MGKNPLAIRHSPLSGQCIILIAFHATGAGRDSSTLHPIPSGARMAFMASMDDPKLSTDLQHLLWTAGATPVHLLLRVTAISDQAEAAIEAAGFQIQRKLTLVPVFAVTGPVAGVLDLLDLPWLINADLDRPVHTH